MLTGEYGGMVPIRIGSGKWYARYEKDGTEWLQKDYVFIETSVDLRLFPSIYFQKSNGVCCRTDGALFLLRKCVCDLSG